MPKQQLSLRRFICGHEIDVDIDQFVAARARSAVVDVRAVEVEVPVPATKPERFQPRKSPPVFEEGHGGGSGRRHGVDLETELFDFGQ